MKKVFGGINLSYKFIVISACLIGILVGGLNSVPALFDTTITDIATYFEFWILCGIFIIMNSESNIDSAMKCFIFFLISQPLIYLVEVPFSNLGWEVFKYYPFWGLMTVLCLPMGYVGYYLKKDKWWGLLILTPIIVLLTSSLIPTIRGLIYSFPHHLINLLLILSTSIIYPLVIFDNKKIKRIGLVISLICIAIFSFMALSGDSSYETTLKCSCDEFYYDNNYKVYLEDDTYGDLNLEYYDDLSSYCINAKFRKTGDTKLVVDDQKGNVKKYNLSIGKNTYDLDLKD